VFVVQYVLRVAGGLVGATGSWLLDGTTNCCTVWTEQQVAAEFGFRSSYEVGRNASNRMDIAISHQRLHDEAVNHLATCILYPFYSITSLSLNVVVHFKGTVSRKNNRGQKWCQSISLPLSFYRKRFRRFLFSCHLVFYIKLLSII